MRKTTCIRNASWLVAWDEIDKELYYMRRADLAFQGIEIIHVGQNFSGAVDEEIDGSSLMVMPGLINTHFHSTATMSRKGITEDAANYFLPSFYQNQALLQSDDEARGAGTAYGLGRLLLSGTTTTMDWAMPYPSWINVLADSGIRAYAAPYYASATWNVCNDRDLTYNWNDDGGKSDFKKAIAFMEEAERHPCGRLSAMVAPGELEACTEELLRDSVALARGTGRPFQVHAAEAVREFNEFTRRHGLTPIQWAAKIGLLGERSAIGHAIYLDHHTDVHWPTSRDLGLLADSGTTVTHCPTIYASNGEAVESLGKYIQAGVNIGLGNDTFPHGLLEELRMAILIGRVKAQSDSGIPIHPCENFFNLALSHIVEAATIGGARFLGRDDIGKLSKGCKADLFTVDLKHLDMRPVHDPLRSLIYCAGDRAIRDVFVDGVQVVKDGRLLTTDMSALADTLEMAQPYMLAAVASKPEASGRTAEQMWPLSLRVV